MKVELRDMVSHRLIRTTHDLHVVPRKNEVLRLGSGESELGAYRVVDVSYVCTVDDPWKAVVYLSQFA